MMISTSNLSEKNITAVNMMIDRYGQKIENEAECWIANEGSDVEDAICEAAFTTYGLGALFTSLLSAGYIKEEKAMELLVEGMTAKMDEEYDRW